MGKLAEAHRFPGGKEVADAVIGLVRAGRSLPLETFQDPWALEVVLGAKPIIEKTRRKEPWNEDDKRLATLYIMIIAL